MKNKFFHIIAVFIFVLSVSACTPVGEDPAAPDNDPPPAAADNADQDVNGDDQSDGETDSNDAAAHDDADDTDDNGGGDDVDSEPDIPTIDGAALFEKGKCAGCHRGDRTGLFAPSILPKDLTKDPADYIEKITNGVENTQMPAHKDKFTSEEIEALVDWLMSDSE